MLENWLFDLALVGILIAYSVYGWRHGFVHSVAGVAGLLAGAILAVFAVPIIGQWVPQATWRVVVIVSVSVFLVLGGHSLGTAIGRRLIRSVKRTALQVADRVLGAVASLIATALVLMLVSSSAVSLGIPALSRTIAGSTVLRTIGAITPDPVEAFVARLRSTLFTSGLPAISEALGGIIGPQKLPEVDTGSPELAAAAQSVVRITGTAPSCNQTQSGSGFVVSDDRIVTNAHVVAGVSEPVIETPAGQALAGTIVYFDPVDDLAVIAVPGLNAPPLVLTTTASTGHEGVIDGYPFGGPFATSPAKVLSIDNAQVFDIYHSSQSPREVYTLATEVNEGNSGGPFLTVDGEVAGVVFARAANTENVGYAMTMAELDPVAAQAASLTQTVDSGACTTG